MSTLISTKNPVAIPTTTRERWLPLAVLFAALPREIAAHCPAVGVFVTAGIRDADFVEQHVQGITSLYIRWDDGDESPNGQYLTISRDGEWEFGFKGRDDYGVAEYRGMTLPAHHLGRWWQMRRAGFSALRSWRCLLAVDRLFHGPLQRPWWFFPSTLGVLTSPLARWPLHLPVNRDFMMVCFLPLLSLPLGLWLLSFVPTFRQGWLARQRRYPTVEAV